MVRTILVPVGSGVTSLGPYSFFRTKLGLSCKPRRRSASKEGVCIKGQLEANPDSLSFLHSANLDRRKGRTENCKTGGDAGGANDAGRPCLGSTIRRMSAAPAQKKYQHGNTGGWLDRKVTARSCQQPAPFSFVASFERQYIRGNTICGMRQWGSGHFISSHGHCYLTGGLHRCGPPRQARFPRLAVLEAGGGAQVPITRRGSHPLAVHWPQPPHTTTSAFE